MNKVENFYFLLADAESTWDWDSSCVPMNESAQRLSFQAFSTLFLLLYLLFSSLHVPSCLAHLHPFLRFVCLKLIQNPNENLAQNKILRTRLTCHDNFALKNHLKIYVVCTKRKLLKNMISIGKQFSLCMIKIFTNILLTFFTKLESQKKKARNEKEDLLQSQKLLPMQNPQQLAPSFMYRVAFTFLSCFSFFSFVRCHFGN